MKLMMIVMLAAMLAGAARAEIVGRAVEYACGGTKCIGWLAYDDALQGRRPGVLVVHEWYGLNDYAKQRAAELARMGYVAFAADMYGGGKVAADPAEAGKLAGAIKADPALMRARARAALDVLAGDPRVDRERLAAIGFCFGGTTVLELAYSGAPLAGVVSFHGGLVPLKPEDAKHLKAALLILHGADDPNAGDVAAFQKSMRDAGADWQMIYYGGAVHSFTNPAAGNDKSRGAAYDRRAAERSWRHMKLFFDEIFK